MDELAYAISLENADALAAMGRFNGSADTLNAKMNGMRTSAAGAGQATQSLFDKVAHLGANLANTVAGAQALGKILEWLKGPQALTGVTTAARGAASGALLAGGAFGGAALGVTAFGAAIAAALPIVVAISAAVVALGAAAKGLGLAAEFEQTNIAFKTLTGSAETAKQVIQELGDMAIDTPFSEKDLQGAAKSMLAARVPAAALKGELTTMGNIAAATGGDIGRLSNVYSQVAGKGKLYAEELQQFVEQGAGEIRQAVAEELGVTTAKLNEMMAAGEVGFSTLQGALTRLAGAGGKWGQGMADQSKTTLGLLSSLKDSVGKVLRLLAQPINDGPIKAVLTTAVEVATKAASVLQNAMAKGKVGEALKQSLILGAKLGVNATLDFFAALPGKLKAILKKLSDAIAAALSGSFADAGALIGSFNTDSLRFDTSAQQTFFKSLTDGAEKAGKAIQETNDWAKTLDATTSKETKDKKDAGGKEGMSDSERQKRAQDMAQNRNDIMGEIAQLKALAAGRKSAADEIERELRIQKDKLDIMRQTGASEEQAQRLAEQKAKLQDRIDGKRSKIGGVGAARFMGESSGPLSNNGPLTEGGGIDGFYRLQSTRSFRRENSLIPGNKPFEPKTVFVPNFGGSLADRGRVPSPNFGNTFDVAGRVNTAAAAPAAAARGAANGPQTQTADPTLAELQKIHAELTRIRTA